MALLTTIWIVSAIHISTIRSERVFGNFTRPTSMKGTPFEKVSMQGTPWENIILDGKTVGEGAFGTASYHQLKKPCEGDVVVKDIRSCSDTIRNQLYQEIVALMTLQHPNILRLYDYFPHDVMLHCKPTNAVLLTEPAMAGELKEVLEKYKFNDYFGDRGLVTAYFDADDRHVAKAKLILNVLIDTLRGLAFMHEVGYMHRDLKPENIWGMTPDSSCIETLSCRFVLGDLGIAMAPEHQFYKLLPNVSSDIVYAVSEPSGNGHLLDTFIKHGQAFEVTSNQIDQASGVYYFQIAQGEGWFPFTSADGTSMYEPVKSKWYTTSVAGTRKYQPEETLNPWSPKVYFKSDVWALGISIEEAFTSNEFRLWGGLNQYSRNSVNKIRNRINGKEYLPQKLRSLLWQMTEHNFEDRPSAAEASKLAEEIAQETFGTKIPERISFIPPCLSNCTALPGEGPCQMAADGSVTRA